MSAYKQQAQQQYDSGYNQKVQALKNQLASQQQSLEQQKGGINQNYDISVGNANLNNRMNKNNVSNTMLGRGLGNSSVAVSGLAEQDAKNTRIIGNIERSRLSDLNNIDAQKALLAQNMEATLGQMAGDREDAIANLARQLESEQWQRDFQERQLSQQMAIAQMNASGGYGGSGGSSEESGYDETLQGYMDAYGAIMGDPNMTQAERQQAIRGLQSTVSLYGSNSGKDVSLFMEQMRNWNSGYSRSDSSKGEVYKPSSKAPKKESKSIFQKISDWSKRNTGKIGYGSKK